MKGTNPCNFYFETITICVFPQILSLIQIKSQYNRLSKISHGLGDLQRFAYRKNGSLSKMPESDSRGGDLVLISVKIRCIHLRKCLSLESQRNELHK